MRSFAFGLVLMVAGMGQQPAWAQAVPAENVAVPPTAPAAPTAPVPDVPEVVITQQEAAQQGVTLGNGARANGGMPGLTLPDVTLPSTLPRPAPSPAAPPRAPTPREVAHEIAPSFNVDRDYARLTQCYAHADMTESLLRVQARRNGNNAQLRQSIDSVAGLKNGMQPLVLAASTVHTEAKFRSDYLAIEARLQRQLGQTRNPNALVNQWLSVVNGCRPDINRWRTRPNTASQ